MWVHSKNCLVVFFFLNPLQLKKTNAYLNRIVSKYNLNIKAFWNNTEKNTYLTKNVFNLGSFHLIELVQNFLFGFLDVCALLQSYIDMHTATTCISEYVPLIFENTN